ncbi:MAG: hypothetical protein H6Q53_2387 [Deltaproteobacteria bacterium]|nr:hypothetical protein [Deltaproteobacteria bacterium]
MRNSCVYIDPGNGLPCVHLLRSEKPGHPSFCNLPGAWVCTEWLRRNLDEVSYSSAQDFIRCRQRYYLRYVKGLKLKPEHLPEAIKLSKGWKEFMRGQYQPGYDHSKDIGKLGLNETQWAKLSALMRAFNELEMGIKKDGYQGCRQTIHVPIKSTGQQIVGVVDRGYADHVVKITLSSRPEFYQARENIAFQVGTYFLGWESWRYVDVEITRTPSLKTKDGEDPDAYEARLYSDILSRPSYYFLGLDKQERTYGVRFWKSEFDLDEIYCTFVTVLREIQRTLGDGAWWKNLLACHVPAACEFLPIKRSGVISSEIYAQKKKGGELNE